MNLPDIFCESSWASTVPAPNTCAEHGTRKVRYVRDDTSTLSTTYDVPHSWNHSDFYVERSGPRPFVFGASLYPTPHKSVLNIIAHEMVFRTRHEGGEFFQQILGRQDDVSGPVAPRAFEAIEKASIGQRL